MIKIKLLGKDLFMIQTDKKLDGDFLREVYIETDNDGIIVLASENTNKILGYKNTELVGNNIKDILQLKDSEIRDEKKFSKKIIKGNGNSININIAIKSIKNNSKKIGNKISIIDITEYIKNDKNELISIFDNSKDIVYRAEAYPEFKFTYLSPYLEEILGYSLEEHYNNHNLIHEIMHPKDKEYMKNKIAGKIDYSKPTQARYRHKDGHYIWLEDFATPIYKGDTIIAFEGISRDITKQKTYEEKLKQMSYHDYLTGAYSKFYLEKYIEKLNNHINIPIGVFFCDLDNLKITNDIYGHELGDKLIIQVSDILKEVFSRNSIVARNGGDEFVIIVRDTSENEMDQLHELLFEVIERKNENNDNLEVAMSIGHSFSKTSLGKVRQVIKEADKEMYVNKIKNKKKPQYLFV